MSDFRIGDILIRKAVLKRKKKEKKENIIRNKKARGEEHINHVNKIIPAREVGPNCRCTKLGCFGKFDEATRKFILGNFNDLANKNSQDAYLMSLISTAPAARHTVENSKKFRMSSYKYKIRHGEEEHRVCLKAFCNIHGVKEGRVRRLQGLLSTNVLSPNDQRGKHKENRVKQTPEPVLLLIRNHIASYKSRQSHYSRRDNPNCLYLSEDLNVNLMHQMFLEKHKINVSYIVYWSIFKKEFNLKFGLPRTDTCATCDEYRLKMQCAALAETKSFLKTEHTLHLRKSEKFHEIKKKYKAKAEAGEAMSLSFDYMQNLPLPHIRTGDVFYARQLWNFVFGIHDMGQNKVCMNSYIETEGKKGQNDVTSLLLKYINEHNITSENLVLFSDGCPGQNKNYVMVQFLYSLVHIFSLFSSVLYVYPIRGHSFLPNDQDFSQIGTKKKNATVETPEEWDKIMEKARKNPSPFEVKRVTHNTFFYIKSALMPYFLKNTKPLMKLKDVRMLKIEKKTNFVFVKYNYTGPWTQIHVRSKRRLPQELNLTPLYSQSLPLNPHKAADLKKLRKFLVNPASLEFYDLITTQVELVPETINDMDIDNEDNSSGDDN